MSDEPIPVTDEQSELLSNAALCQAFRTSEMYKLLDSMMEALESDALNALSEARTNNKEELYGFTIRWQERKLFRQRIKEEIDSNIEDAKALLNDIGLDPQEWAIRSVM